MQTNEVANREYIDQELAIIEGFNPVLLYTEDGLMDVFLKEVERKALETTFDLETKEGRDELASFAYKISRIKTTVDGAGKGLTAEWRKKTEGVNKLRKKVTGALDPLKKKVRKPLTDYEEEEKRKEEKARAEEEAKINERMARLSEYGCILQFQTVAAMTDEEFDDILGKEKADFERRQAEKAEAEAKAKAEEEAREAEKAELKKQAEEQAQQKAELDAKMKEIEEREAALDAKEEKAEEDPVKDDPVEKEPKILATGRATFPKIPVTRQDVIASDKNKIRTWLNDIVNALSGPDLVFPENLDDPDSIKICQGIQEGFYQYLANANNELDNLYD